MTNKKAITIIICSQHILASWITMKPRKTAAKAPPKKRPSAAKTPHARAPKAKVPPPKKTASRKRQIADESSDDEELSSDDEPPPPKKRKQVIQEVTDEEPEEDDVEIVDGLENTRRPPTDDEVRVSVYHSYKDLLTCGVTG
jgi:hypothetical protein